MIPASCRGLCHAERPWSILVYRDHLRCFPTLSMTAWNIYFHRSPLKFPAIGNLIARPTTLCIKLQVSDEMIVDKHGDILEYLSTPRPPKKPTVKAQNVRSEGSSDPLDVPSAKTKETAKALPDESFFVIAKEPAKVPDTAIWALSPSN